jgi:hypothetical protein
LVLVSFLLALWKPKTHNTTAQLGQEIMTQQNFSLKEKIKAEWEKKKADSSQTEMWRCAPF